MQIGVSTWYPDQPVIRMDPAAASLIARMTTPPTPARAALIDTAIISLKASGVWDKLDVLWVTAAADSQAAGLNWKSASFTLSPVNSPTFTADRGYTGDSTTSYLTTGYNPSTSAIYKQNDAHLGVYVNSNPDGANNSMFEMGTYTASSAGAIDVLDSPGNLKGRANDVGVSVITTVANGLGHSVVYRNNASNFSGYKNGVQLSVNATASASPPNGLLYLCARNSIGTAAGFSTRRVAAAHVGNSLNLTEAAALYSALYTYLNAIGAA